MADLCERCAGWRYISVVRYPTHWQQPCPVCNPIGQEPVSPDAPEWMRRFHDPNAWSSDAQD